MADEKVSQLTAITDLVSTDLLYVASSPFATNADSHKIDVTSLIPSIVDRWSALLTAKTTPADADVFALDQSPFGNGDARKITAINLVNYAFDQVNQFTAKVTPADADLLPLDQSPFGTGDRRKITAINFVNYSFDQINQFTAKVTPSLLDVFALDQSPFGTGDRRKITAGNVVAFTLDQVGSQTAKITPADADVFALDQTPFGVGDRRSITAINVVDYAFDQINQFTAKVTPAGVDLFPLDQSPFGVGDKRKITAANLAAYVLSTLFTNSSYYTFVGGQATDTANGTALVNAYAAAKLLTPGGNALSTSNRHTLILLPGRYSVTDGALVLNTQFIDVIGLSTDTGPYQYTGSGPTEFGETIITSNGHTVGLTVNDVILANLALLTSSTSKFALNVSSSSATQRWQNLLIWNTSNVANPSMAPTLSPAGQYQDVRCWNESAFGNSNTTNASGIFYRCKAGSFSFGTAISSGSTCSGFFYDCEADGASFGTNGTASGTFIRCKYVATEASASSMFGGAGTASGYFEDCVANGVDGCFGNTASGTFVRCRSIRTTGGAVASGGAFGSGTTGVASGLFMYCEAGNSSFGSGGATGKTASGVFNYCKAGTNSFGGGGTNAGTMSGTMFWCSMTGFLNASVTGKIEHMRIEATGTDQSAVLINGGKLYNCTLIATGTGNSVFSSSGGAVNATIAHCRMNKGIDANVTNLIATPYIVNDTNVT